MTLLIIFQAKYLGEWLKPKELKDNAISEGGVLCNDNDKFDSDGKFYIVSTNEKNDDWY